MKGDVQVNWIMNPAALIAGNRQPGAPRTFRYRRFTSISITP